MAATVNLVQQYGHRGSGEGRGEPTTPLPLPGLSRVASCHLAGWCKAVKIVIPPQNRPRLRTYGYRLRVNHPNAGAGGECGGNGLNA